MLVMVDGRVYNSDEMPVMVVFTKDIEIETAKRLLT